MVDEYRRLTLTINAWVYHKDNKDIKLEEFTNTYTEEESDPFASGREEWKLEKLEKIIKKLTGEALALWERYGITGPAGGPQKSPSFNWAYRIIDANEEYRVKEIPEPFKEQYIRLKSISEIKTPRKIKGFEDEREEIRKRAKDEKRELTKEENSIIWHLNTLIEKAERSITLDKKKIKELEEKYSGIEKLYKEKKKRGRK